jgi:hypothetical protein
MARQASLIISHWHKLFEGFQESPQQIYGLLDKAIEQRKLPNIKTSRITYRETGVLSAKREYLRVRRKEHIFDICAAPFGTGFFVSWWLGQTPGLIASLILKIPLLGRLLVGAFRPETYYSLDTALMFQDSVHTAVLEVLDQVTEGKGIKALSELEKKPIMSDLFKRKLA